MAIYTVEIDGKQYDIEGDKEPTEQEARQAVGEYQPQEQPQSQQEQQLQQPSMERQNILGQLFNVPGAAVRSTLQGKGYMQGALNPSQVPKFQDLALDAYYSKLPDFPGKTALGMGVSAAGLAADVATDPTALLLMLTGKAPIGKKLAVPTMTKSRQTLESIVAASKPGQAIGRFLQKERNLPDFKNMFKSSGIPKSDAFFLEQADKAYNIANSAKKTVSAEINTFRDATKNTPVKVDNLQPIIDDLFGKTSKDVSRMMPQQAKFETKLILPDELVAEMKSIVEVQPKVNLNTVYKMKDAVAKHIKPKTWNDFKIGNPVTADQDKLVTSYFRFDKIIDDSLSGSGLTEEKMMLDYLNQKATIVYDLARETKKMVSGTSKTVREPSKLIGAFLGGEEKSGKRGILKAMSELEPQMNDVIKAMAKFRDSQRGKELLKRMLKIGALGAAAKTGIGLMK